jgi:ferric-dicitrate binding protein FerR (iron transport regulator)
MKEDIPWKILEEKFKEEISEEKDNQLNLWLIHQPENVIIYNQLKSYYNQHKRLPTHFNPDSSWALKKFQETILTRSAHSKRRILLYWTKIAAAVFIIVLGFWFLQKSDKVSPIHYTTIAASDTAMLRYKTPDHSTIWLKAKSKIRYADNFEKNRTIYLIGEAYFEVAHNKSYPFKVFAGNSVTTVVGTKFNISSWVTHPNIEITVTDGKVIFGKEKGNAVALVKGQRGVLTKSDELITIQTPEANYLSWMTKEFYFDNTPLNTIMEKLADVYQFKFDIPNQSLKEIRLTAKFSKRPLAEIIQTLEVVTGKQITQTNNIYTIH